MRFYIVAFDRVSTKSYKEFHDEFVTHAGIRYWWHYVKSVYLIGTETFTADTLADHYAAVAVKHGIPRTHLILRVNLDTRNGFLTKDAWEWIDRHKSEEK